MLDGGRVGQPVCRDGGTLTHLDPDIGRAQHGEGVLVGDVVADVQHAEHAEALAQPLDRHTLARLDH